MSDPVMSALMRLELLNRALAVGGPLVTPTLILIGPRPVKHPGDLLMADIVQPVFVGYAAEAAVEMGDPYPLPAGDAAVDGPAVAFTCTATPAAPVEIWGWALVNAGLTAIHAVFVGEKPLATVQAAGQVVAVQPRVVLPRI